MASKNRVVEDRWAAYCQAIHLHKLLHTKSELPKCSDSSTSSAPKVKNSKRKEIERERQEKIQRENETLLKKILEIDRSSKARVRARQEKKKTRIKRAKQKLEQAEKNKDRIGKQAALEFIDQASLSTTVHLVHANRVASRSTRMKREQQRLANENERFLKRLLSAKSTISSKRLESEAKKRERLLKNMSDYKQHRVLDLSHLTLHAVQSGQTDVSRVAAFSNIPKAPNTPKTPRSRPYGGLKVHRKLRHNQQKNTSPVDQQGQESFEDATSRYNSGRNLEGSEEQLGGYSDQEDIQQDLDDQERQDEEGEKEEQDQSEGEHQQVQNEEERQATTRKQTSSETHESVEEGDSTTEEPMPWSSLLAQSKAEEERGQGKEPKVEDMKYEEDVPADDNLTIVDSTELNKEKDLSSGDTEYIELPHARAKHKSMKKKALPHHDIEEMAEIILSESGKDRSSEMFKLVLPKALRESYNELDGIEGDPRTSTVSDQQSTEKQHVEDTSSDAADNESSGHEKGNDDQGNQQDQAKDLMEDDKSTTESALRTSISCSSLTPGVSSPCREDYEIQSLNSDSVEDAPELQMSNSNGDATSQPQPTDSIEGTSQPQPTDSIEGASQLVTKPEAPENIEDTSQAMDKVVDENQPEEPGLGKQQSSSSMLAQISSRDQRAAKQGLLDDTQEEEKEEGQVEKGFDCDASSDVGEEESNAIFEKDDDAESAAIAVPMEPSVENVSESENDTGHENESKSSVEVLDWSFHQDGKAVQEKRLQEAHEAQHYTDQVKKKKKKRRESEGEKSLATRQEEYFARQFNKYNM